MERYSEIDREREGERRRGREKVVFELFSVLFLF